MRISIDLSQVLSGYSLTREEVDSITQRSVESVTFAIYNEILNQASQNLRSTRRIYRDNVNFPVIEKFRGTIVLTGALPNMIERGASPFDMKIGFSKSNKRKTKKDGGWYMTIPFRWGTPDSIADNEVFSGKMDREVYDIIKGKEAFMTMPSGEKKSGKPITLDDLKSAGAADRLTRGARTIGGKTFGAYKHKSPLQQGIRKEQKLYENALQSKYVSFRRISDKSEENSWLYKGLEPYRLFDKAVDETDRDAISARAINAEMRKLKL